MSNMPQGPWKSHPREKKKKDPSCNLGFPGDSEGKVSTCNAGDRGSIPGLERSPGEGNGNPLQYSLLGKFHGRRSLVGYSSWDRRVRHDWATSLTHSLLKHKMFHQESLP